MPEPYGTVPKRFRSLKKTELVLFSVLSCIR